MADTSGSTKGRTPDPALIDSMAMRYRHDFGLLTEQQQNSVRRKMIQLWEEVVGLGFYKQPSEPDAKLNRAARRIADGAALMRDHLSSCDRTMGATHACTCGMWAYSKLLRELDQQPETKAGK